MDRRLGPFPQKHPDYDVQSPPAENAHWHLPKRKKPELVLDVT